ncbi:MAG: glycosyltransferase [Coleofasciculaceae cyanobacterium]
MLTKQLITHPASERKYSDRLMLFDLSVRGHHPNYIKHLIKYWCEQQLSGCLDIVVSPKFLEEHADVVELAASYNQEDINFVAITLEEETALNARKSRLRRAWRNFQEWQLLGKYARALNATHCLIMYFDTCMFPLALGGKSPCTFSGIYFRPAFHYAQLTNYQPSWKDRLQQWRERLLLSRILRHPKLQTVYCLDPFAVEQLDKFSGNVKVVNLPDPVETSGDLKPISSNIKGDLGIESQRQVFLLFGALTERKGIYQVLEAIEALSPELCQKICLLLVGESNIEEQLKPQIKALCRSKPVQIICRYKFVPEQDVQTYFNLADVILALYQKHVGMSGILLLAAAAQKPVLSSDYGLMGEIVQRHELGLTIDSTKPSEIAQGLTQFLLKPSTKLCNPTKMKDFAQQNSAQNFANTILHFCLKH